MKSMDLELLNDIETTTVLSETESLTTTVTTVTDLDLPNISAVDVDLLNTFLYLGTAFILAFFFWFVCKGLYKLLCMFF